MRVADEIRTEIRKEQFRKMRGEIRAQSLDAHRMLVRLKIAGLLAVLDGHDTEIRVDDWTLAGRILTRSDRARERAVRAVQTERARKERETSARLARRQVDAVSAVETRRTVDAARSIAQKVWSEEQITRRT